MYHDDVIQDTRPLHPRMHTRSTCTIYATWYLIMGSTGWTTSMKSSFGDKQDKKHDFFHASRFVEHPVQIGFIPQQLGATSSILSILQYISMNRIFTEDEVLRIGLLFAGFNAHRQQRVERATCEGRFKSQYSSSPLVCAKVWEDLVTSPDIWENQTYPNAASFEKFLMALYFLKSYPTEERLAAMWKTCEKPARKWAWFFVEMIQALKKKKMSCMPSG